MPKSSSAEQGGKTGGAFVASPTEAKILRMASLEVIYAIRLIFHLHPGQEKTSMTKAKAKRKSKTS